MIDTPGLRELQLWQADEGISQAFADIDEWAKQCRFTDCRHKEEPGCAVQEALRAGILDWARLESRRKLQCEQEFLRRKIDPEARQVEKRRIKQIMRNVRQMYRERKAD